MIDTRGVFNYQTRSMHNIINLEKDVKYVQMQKPQE